MTGWVVCRVWNSSKARREDYDLHVLTYPVPMLGQRVDVVAGPFSVYEDARRDLLRRLGAPL